jgi:hypothetical protein
MGARVVETEVAVGRASEKFDEDGHLVDEEIREKLNDALGVLLAEAAPHSVAA